MRPTLSSGSQGGRGRAAPEGRSRRAGGGRKRAEAHDEDLVATFESLIDPVTRGDPMSPLRWTSKSIRSLTGALREKGHRVSDSVTRRLLKERGYSLQANAKTIEGNQHADRDASSPISTTRPRTIWAPGIR